jgi:hypothetical protein
MYLAEDEDHDSYPPLFAGDIANNLGSIKCQNTAHSDRNRLTMDASKVSAFWQSSHTHESTAEGSASTPHVALKK